MAPADAAGRTMDAKMASARFMVNLRNLINPADPYADASASHSTSILRPFWLRDFAARSARVCQPAKRRGGNVHPSGLCRSDRARTWR